MQASNRSLGILPRLAVAGALLAFMLAAGISVANAVEIIPSAGLTRNVDQTTANMFGSLAVRGQVMPLLATELGVAYRSESHAGDLLKVRMWPVTASMWVTPIPAFYAGGGVGWYNITFDYDDAVAPPLQDHTEQEFGVHLGGGVRVPLAPSAAVDLNGRYVMLRNQDEDRLIPEQFNPNFWQMSAGLAFKF
jgi:Outer membrane protein beta-barrel domain